jgi:hypothetical protein
MAGEGKKATASGKSGVKEAAAAVVLAAVPTVAPAATVDDSFFFSTPPVLVREGGATVPKNKSSDNSSDTVASDKVASDKVASDKVVDQFVKDWGYHYAAHTLASAGADDRNAKFLAVNHVAIPCKQEDLGEKAVPVSLTLLRAHSAGYGVAPYARNMTKGTETKKLFEMIPGGSSVTSSSSDDDGSTSSAIANAMRLWSYEKKSMARGPRCDDMPFEVHVGDTIIYLVSPQTFEGMKMDDPTSNTNSLPVDISVIPEMSLLEITISPKSRESCLAGSGVRVVTICMADPSISLYSLPHPDLPFLPKSQKEYQSLVTTRREQFSMLVRDLEEGKAGFFLDKCPVTSFINDDNLAAGNSNMVQLVLGSGVLDDGDFIDISLDSLLKYTNTNNVKHACALIECAAALGALRMFVAFNPFWGRKGSSPYRGITLIDSGVFFTSLDKPFLDDVSSVMKHSNGPQLPPTVTAPTGSVYDSLSMDFSLSLVANAITRVDRNPVPTPDFAIVGPGFNIPKAYNFSVDLRDADGIEDNINGVFMGFFNVSSASAGGITGSWGGSSKFKRRQRATMA